MRPRQVHLEMARDARPYPSARHLARPGGRTHSRTRCGCRRAHAVGCGGESQERGDNRRHIPQRSAPHRSLQGGWWQNSRASSAQTHRKHHPPWHHHGEDEDWHTGAYRQAKRAFRRDGSAGRRERLPQVQLPRRPATPQATHLLDLLHQPGGARRPARRPRRLPPLQRPDTKHRTQILPLDRDEARHLPRARATHALPRTGRRKHQ